MNFQQLKTTVLTLAMVLVGTLVWANDSKMSNVELQASYGRKLGITLPICTPRRRFAWNPRAVWN